MERFYLADEKHESLKHPGTVVEHKDVLQFEFKRPGVHGGPPYHFDSRATEEHVRSYPEAFKEFKKAHPKWVSRWEWVEKKFAPKAVVAEESAAVEEVVQEKPKKSKKDK
jgi:hypothetical protein